ncbi:uncharacterized protein LOC142616429 [Castanea sativa]|uniref:uncharacterized protein LOC142616429 n=1 Tax=Castanea sativa TaxID=21020 RepID=UPI003F651310
MEKLMGSWEKLSLSKSKGSKFAIKDDPDVEEHVLAAKFLTRRALNMEVIAKTRKGFEIKDMGDHRVLFVFSDATDVDRGLMGEPWTFDRHLVVLEKMNSDDAIEEMSFNHTSFWVQVHDLPVRCLSLEVALEIVLVVGKVYVNASQGGGSNNFNFFRTKIKMDIKKPLCRGRRITMVSGKEGWVSFKYERLPNICYWCGRLTHSDRECPMWVKSRGTLKVEDQQFGAWLRAVTLSMSHRTVIRVPGMDEEENGYEEVQQNGREGVDEGIGSRRRTSAAAEGAGVAWHGEESSDVADKINEDAIITEIPLNSDPIKDDYPITDITLNSLAHLNSGTKSQRADFSEQLKDIDNELLKYDNVHAREEVPRERVSKEDSGLQRESIIIGPEVLGLHFNYEVANEKGMTQKMGWICREQSRGPEFTWHGKRRGELVWERLDRGVANYEWLNKFPIGRVQHLHRFTSNHKPLLLALDPNGESNKWKRKPFRFEAMWLMDRGCSDTVTRAWVYRPEGTPMFQATEKLRKCKKMLKKWSREHFGNVKQQIEKTKKKLWQAEVVSAREGKDEDVVRLKAELNMLCEKEEQMWHQRSRLQWIKNGDRNTQFFHGTTTQRKRRNFIKGLRDSDGRWQSEEGIYTKILVDFYKDLFTTSNPHNLDSSLDGIQKVVTKEMNAKLTTTYTMEEVELAIKEMAPIKEMDRTVIANRLKPFLNSIISETQSAFIAGRQIIDNILIAFESLHHMKTNCTRKSDYMAVKLDMSKAYDRVEWIFLEKILLKLGFQNSWVSLIMECITTVTYSIMVNGEPQGMITPTRGIRQGDPLSPYIFLFCVEGLDALLPKAANDGDINGNKKAFTYIKERILAKMQGWKEKLLSQAGKEVMIKAVIQSISAYSMNVFKLPDRLCKDIEAMIRKFWWGSGEGKKIHWIWRLLHQKNTLLYKVFSAKYFPDGNILDAPIPTKCSYAWKSILQSRKVIQKGVAWRVGDGRSRSIWEHNWLPEPGMSRVVLPRIDMGLNRNNFYPWEAEVIRRIYISEACNTDCLVWPKSSDGCYTVKSAYQMLATETINREPSLSNEGDSKGSAFTIALFSTIAWSIWQRRNRVLVQQPSWPLHEISRRAKDLVVEFFDAHQQPLRSVEQGSRVRWTKPPEDFYKANFDAALFDSSNMAGIGVVIRDCNGNVIGALSQRIALSKSINHAEALVASQVMAFARELSLFRVIFEGDCLRIIKAINAKEPCHTLFGHIIEEQGSLTSSLTSCNFQHVKREGNNLAHALARRVVVSADTDVWVEELPWDLEDVFNFDLE